MDGKTILVTGGSGFIGSNFIEYCFKTFDNIKIINLDKMGIGSRVGLKVIDQNYEFYNIDLSHMSALLTLERMLKIESLDYIFHFAAESHVDRSISSPASFIRNNTLSTTTILDYAIRNFPKTNIVCISTDEVYGHLNHMDPPFTHNSPLAPRSPYAASKAASDLIALSYKTTYDLNLIVTRCCNNFGPHQGDEKFIPTIIKNLVNNTEIPVYGTGENIREWIYVEDHNRAVIKAASYCGCSDHVNNIWNIGSGIEYCNLSLISTIADSMNIDNPKIKMVEDRKAHDFRYAIENMVAYEPSGLSFIEAMDETIKFYMNKYSNSKQF